VAEISSAAPNSQVPAEAHHSRTRAAPPRRRASAPSSHAAPPSTTKNTATAGQTTECGAGRPVQARTGNVLSAHAADATGHQSRRSGRSRLTNRNVNSGLASNRAMAVTRTQSGGFPTYRLITLSTNSMATDANIHITSRSSGSRRRRYRHDTHDKINANSEVTRTTAIGTSVPPAEPAWQ
jgi:hypothetical protein